MSQIMERILLSAPSGSGKTSLLVKLLTEDFLYKFHKIFIFSPTMENDKKVWQEFHHKYPDEIFEVYEDLDEEKLYEILELSKDEVSLFTKERADKFLIIIDDLITSKSAKSKVLTEVFFKGRHHGISIIITSQSYMRLDRNMRLNLTSMYIFSPSPSEMKRIAEDNENVSFDAKKIVAYLKEHTSKRYHYVKIDKLANPDNLLSHS